jgi:hypothetical protein
MHGWVYGTTYGWVAEMDRYQFLLAAVFAVLPVLYTLVVLV